MTRQEKLRAATYVFIGLVLLTLGAARACAGLIEGDAWDRISGMVTVVVGAYMLTRQWYERL